MRASNIPSRYVKGVIQFNDDQRLLDWVGAKTSTAAASILLNGRIPYESYNPSTNSFSFTHVWVEACVPYGNYRGTANDDSGNRWIPVDPSFKNKTYQEGINVNVNFDYDQYMSGRTFELPHEFYENQVRDSIRTLPPRYENNELDDVAYKGRIEPQKYDVLPASLPYTVLRYLGWDNGTNAETASLPARHRYTLTVNVDGNTATFDMPVTAMSRNILTFEDCGKPTIRQNGMIVFTGVSAVTCSPTLVTPVPTPEGTASLNLSVHIGKGTSSVIALRSNNFAGVSRTAIHALQAFALQTSDQYLKDIGIRLTQAVKLISNPSATPETIDETLGMYLHYVSAKYMHYIDTAARKIGELKGVSLLSGNHLGIASSKSTISYLFDLPYAINTDGFLIDLPGGIFKSLDITTGDQRFDAFLLASYSGSAYESYIWQENARMDAVSSVRGIQYANDNDIEVLTLTPSLTTTQLNAQLNKLTTNASLNHASSTATIVRNLVNAGGTVTIPRSLIAYGAWTGLIYVESNPSRGATFKISQYNGGYTISSNPIDISFNPLSYSNPSILSTGYALPSSFTQSGGLFTPISAPSTISSSINLGAGSSNTFAGDPVNMVGSTDRRNTCIKSLSWCFVF